VVKNDLHITILQSNLYWENCEANLQMFSEKIDSFQNPTNLILLPEMFTTGFSMQPEKFAESMDGAAIHWMKEMAKKKNAVLCGSMMMSDEGKYFNRLIWMKPDGSCEHYDKRHLFGLGDENKHYTRGEKKNMVELNGWKILPLICYDLRFPVWSRNMEGYDLLLYVANWPEKRIDTWKTLLEARAIENQSYVIGLNRVGSDASEMYYSGESSVIDPKGEILWREANREYIHHVTLSYHHLQHTRETFPFLKDKDQFEIK
jgi:predicted amidohydrolase